MTGFIEAILFGDARAAPRWRTALGLIACCLIAGGLYGAAMGSYGAFREKPAALQAFYVATKVPMLLLITTALALPSFVVVNTLLGLRDDLAEAVGAVLSVQAAVALALASLAPLVLFFYLNVRGYDAALLCNAVMFGTASVAGQRWLAARYRPLVARNPRHRWTLRAWIIGYAFVGIQMGWTLRPFIGDPRAQTAFFRDEPFTNAYVVVANLIWRVLSQ